MRSHVAVRIGVELARKGVLQKVSVEAGLEAGGGSGGAWAMCAESAPRQGPLGSGMQALETGKLLHTQVLEWRFVMMPVAWQSERTDAVASLAACSSASSFRAFLTTSWFGRSLPA